MTRHDPANGGAGEQVGTCSDDTSTPRQTAGTYLRLSNPASTARDLIDKMGPEHALAVAAVIGVLAGEPEPAPVEPTTDREVMYRVRWRGRHWSPRTSTRTRYVLRGADAHRIYWDLRERGHDVELSRCTRAPWLTRFAAPFSRGPEVQS